MPPGSRDNQVGGLRRTTTIGVALMLGQAIGSRLTAIIGQIVIARFFLQPRDYGLVSLAVAIGFFASQAQEIGIREFLVRRRIRFGRWSSDALWLSIIAGILIALCVAGLAPLAARVYRDGSLTYLLLITALAVPFNGAAVVPTAKLQSELRFASLAIVGFLQNVANTGAAIILASRIGGAASILIAQTGSSILGCAALFIVAKPIVHWHLEFTKWLIFLDYGKALVGAALLEAFISQGDYLSLGLFHSATAVGNYYFAFTVSTQILGILGSTVAKVLFASLSRLQRDASREVAAILLSTRVLAALGVPAGLFVSALAGPLIRMLFGTKWDAAIPMVRILSVSAGIHLVAAPAYGALRAQGRFVRFFWWNVAAASCLLGSALLASYFGNEITVAIAVATYTVIFYPLLIWLAIVRAGAGWRDIGRVYAGPLLWGAVAAFCGYLLCRAIPDARWANVARVLVASPLMVLIFCAALFFFAPRTFRETMDQLQIILRSATRSTTLPAAVAEDARATDGSPVFCESKATGEPPVPQ